MRLAAGVLAYAFLPVGLLFGCGSAQGQGLVNKGETISILAGTTVVVNGSLENAATEFAAPVLENNGALLVSGDFISPHSGAYTGAGALELTGNGSQLVTASEFYTLKVSGAGVKTLGGNSRILHSLVFAGGQLHTGAHQVQLHEKATLTETADSYLTGWITTTRNLSQNTLYDFGGLGFKLIAKDQAPGLTTITRGTGAAAIQHGNENESIARVFMIKPTNNTNLNADINFFYRENELNGIAEDDLSLYQSADDGATWNYEGYTSRSAFSNMLAMAGVNSLSGWTAGSTVNSLPVELVSFTAKSGGDGRYVQLHWATASEKNNAYFEIQRSEDGRTFAKVGEVKGHGSSSRFQHYSFQDDAIANQVATEVYYRLRQVDYTGDASYSKIKAVLLPAGVQARLQAWYAPSRRVIQVDAGLPVAEGVLELYSIQGQKVMQGNISNSNQGELRADGLAKGVYVVVVKTASGARSQRVLVY